MPSDPYIVFRTHCMRLCMCIFLCIGTELCVLVNRERQRKTQTDRRRDRDSQRTGLGGYEACRCIMWDCHACTPPHMCREFDMAQYWFHTASDVSISWSHMNSVFTSCRTDSFCTQRDLNVCCLTYEAKGVQLKYWFVYEEQTLFYCFPNERYPVSCISLQSWSSWHLAMLINTGTRRCAVKEREW